MSKARDWIEKHYGRRPSQLPSAQARAKVKNLTALLKAAERACARDMVYDARYETLELYLRDRAAKGQE